MPLVELPILPGLEGLPPVAAASVPLDGLGDAPLESEPGRPAERADLPGVGGVALVVAGPQALDGADQVLGAAGVLQDHVRELAVRDLGILIRRDVVDLPRGAVLEQEQQRPAVVLDAQPVAHLAAAVVERQRLAVEGVGDEQRE